MRQFYPLPMANQIKVQIGLDTRQADTELKGFTNRFRSAIDANTSSVRALRSTVGGLQTALGALVSVAAFKQVAQFGIDLDKARNAMTALTGSVGAANAKLAELRELAKASPGVTQTFATQLFQQLKAVGGIADQTINKVIKSLGKLNTVFGDIGPEFARNLVQIFQQGFERSDIKEALGRVPIFEQLLERAFGTKDPDKLRKLKAAGKLTLEGFLKGFAEGIDSDPRFKNIQESLGGKLAKQFDETKQKLAELGEKMLRSLIPALEKLLPLVNKLVDFFNALPDGIQAATLALVVLSPAINSVAGAIKVLAGSIGALGVAGSTAGFARIVAFFASPAGIALLGAVGVTASVAGIMQGFERMESDMRQRFDRTPRDLEGKPLFQQGLPVLGSPAEQLKMFRGRVGALDPTKPIGIFPPPPPIPPPPGGTGGKARVDKVAEQIKELKKLIAEGQAAFMEGLVEDMERLNKFIQDQNLDFEKKRKADEAFRSERLLEQRGTRQRLTQEFTAREAETLLRTSRRGLTRSGRFIDDAFSRGAITGGEAELLTVAANAEFANKLREVLAIKEKLLAVNDPLLEDLRDEIALFDQLGTVISDSERFMRGFNSQIETSGDAFDRFGQNVSRAFTNIKDVFNGLKNAVLQFFNDILGNALQNLVRGVLGPIFGGGGGFGNLFRAPGGLAQAFSGGGGLAAPPSVSSGLSSLFGGGRSAGGGLGGLSLDPLTAKQLGGGGGVGSFFGGIGKSFAATAPLLGLSLGIGLGGQSTAGKIFGGIGGALAGSAKGLIGLGSALGIAGLVAAPFFLLGSFFLGKAKQRGKDEEAAGQMLLQAQEQIRQLKAGIANDSIDGSQARAIFESEILTNFRNQIGTLKTGSVKRSRLSNQVADLRKFFDNLVLPEITAQAERRRIAASNALTHSKLIPEFNTGGMARGGLAVLHPGEMVLNQLQQHAVIRQSSPQVFDRAGVPGVQQNAQFPHGGIMPAGSSQHSGDIVIEKLIVGISAEDVFVAGGSGAKGRRVIVKQTEVAMRKGEL